MPQPSISWIQLSAKGLPRYTYRWADNTWRKCSIAMLQTSLKHLLKDQSGKSSQALCLTRGQAGQRSRKGKVCFTWRREGWEALPQTFQGLLPRMRSRNFISEQKSEKCRFWLQIPLTVQTVSGKTEPSLVVEMDWTAAPGWECFLIHYPLHQIDC